VQDTIEKLGKPYLDKSFPQLDSIKTTTLILPEGATPEKAPTSPKKSPAPAAQKP